MKKFTLVSLARAKKSATSALMGLAILFVTLNFVSATLSIKVYSSNPNVSDGAGIQNNGTRNDAFPFWETGLPDDEATARMMFEGDEFHLWDTYFQNDETEPRIMFEDDDFPTLTTSLQNNDAEEAQNLSLNTVDRPASTDEFFRKDLNLLDFEDSLYGHFSFHRPNLTKTLSEKRFDDPQNQERYKNALDYYEAKKSEHEILKYYTPENDPSESDYHDSQEDNINKGPESNVPVVASQIHNERISDDTGKCFDADGYLRPLAAMPEFTSPYSFPPIPGATSGNNPDAVATKNISYTPLHKRTRSEVASTCGITNGNDPDAFPSIWDDSLDGSE